MILLVCKYMQVLLILITEDKLSVVELLVMSLYFFVLLILITEDNLSVVELLVMSLYFLRTLILGTSLEKIKMSKIQPSQKSLPL